MRPNPLPATTPSTIYLRLLSTLSSWLALAGYTFFALLMTSQTDNLRTSRTLLSILAISCLVIGYLGGVLAFFMHKSPSFRLDSVLVPLFLTSLGGLFEIVANHALHKDFPASKAYIYGPLVIASVSTVACAGLAVLVDRKVKVMQSVGTGQKQHMTAHWTTRMGNGYSSDRAPGSGGAFSAGTRARGDSAATELLPMGHNLPEIPEDEAQRRQLLRLLLREQDYRRHGPNSDAGSTYRIEWRGDEDEGEGDVADDRGRQRLSVPQHDRPRSASASSITDKWSIGNLLGGGKRKRPPDRPVDPKQQREERRREIERNSLIGVSQLSPGLSTSSLRESPELEGERLSYGGDGGGGGRVGARYEA